MIKIKITWPAAILILVAVLIWLSRSSAPAHPKPQPVTKRDQSRVRRPEPRAHKSRPNAQPLIIDLPSPSHGEGPGVGPDGTPDLDHMTYEEALRDPNLTHEQVDAVAARELREVFESSRAEFESAQESPFAQVLNQFKSRSYANRER